MSDTHDILVTSYDDVVRLACPRGCHKDATRKLLPWNLGLTACWVQRALVMIASDCGNVLINLRVSFYRQRDDVGDVASSQCDNLHAVG